MSNYVNLFLFSCFYGDKWSDLEAIITKKPYNKYKEKNIVETNYIFKIKRTIFTSLYLKGQLAK